MKKGLLFVAVVTASLASCKKDHTCTCTSTYNGVATSTTPDVTIYTESSKSAARANCVSAKQVDGADTFVRTCELK